MPNETSILKMTAPLEVGISVRNLDQMLSFYTEILGMKVVADNVVKPDLSRILGAADQGYRIIRLQAPYGERIKLVQLVSIPESQKVPAYVFDKHGLAYLTFVIADLDVLIHQLASCGVFFISQSGKVEVRPGVFAVFIRDPEGNMLEFVEYSDVASYRPDIYRIN